MSGPPPIATHCKGTLDAPTVCIENAQGRAGDVVLVQLHLLGSTSCTAAQEAGGRIKADPALFELVNAADLTGCRTRRFVPSLSGVGEDLQWWAFGANTSPGCIDYLPLGERDVIQLRIKAGVAPGDYPLTWAESGFVGDGACQAFDTGLAGTIRVLP